MREQVDPLRAVYLSHFAVGRAVSHRKCPQGGTQRAKDTHSPVHRVLPVVILPDVWAVTRNAIRIIGISRAALNSECVINAGKI